MASQPTTTPEPDDLLVCPYDPSHMVRFKKMPYHLMKHKLQNPNGAEFVTCPFNAQHMVQKHELRAHQAKCPQRHLAEKEIAYQFTKDKFDQSLAKGNTTVPSYDAWKPPEPLEDWDNDGSSGGRDLQAPGHGAGVTSPKPLHHHLTGGSTDLNSASGPPTTPKEGLSSIHPAPGAWSQQLPQSLLQQRPSGVQQQSPQSLLQWPRPSGLRQPSQAPQQLMGGPGLQHQQHSRPGLQQLQQQPSWPVPALEQQQQQSSGMQMPQPPKQAQPPQVGRGRGRGLLSLAMDGGILGSNHSPSGTKSGLTSKDFPGLPAGRSRLAANFGQGGAGDHIGTEQHRESSASGVSRALEQPTPAVGPHAESNLTCDSESQAPRDGNAVVGSSSLVALAASEKAVLNDAEDSADRSAAVDDSGTATRGGSGTVGENAKQRQKKVLKKLRQIADLEKTKQKGGSLNEDQWRKLSEKAALEQELGCIEKELQLFSIKP